MSAPIKKRVRDYAKEYASRIKRAKELEKLTGVKISRAQARGHARTHANEESIAVLQGIGALPKNRTTTLKRYASVMKNLASGKSLTASTRAAKTTNKTFKKLALQRDDISPSGKLVSRYFTVYTSNGVIHESVRVDKRTASILGTYLNLVKDAYGKPGMRVQLSRFKPKTITDIHGNKYTLATKFEVLMLMGAYDNIKAEINNRIEPVVYRLERVA